MSTPSKNPFVSLGLLLFFGLVMSCSVEEVSSDEEMEVLIEGLIIGNWQATDLGVVYDDESEDSSNDPCGTFQNIRFLSDGTFEADHYTSDASGCSLDKTRPGVFEEIDITRFPEANYQLTLIRFGDDAEDIRYPEITFVGNDVMRIQYPWAASAMDNIAYSFVLYRRN